MARDKVDTEQTFTLEHIRIAFGKASAIQWMRVKKDHLDKGLENLFPLAQLGQMTAAAELQILLERVLQSTNPDGSVKEDKPDESSKVH